MRTCTYNTDLNQYSCINPLWMVIPLALILILVIVCDDYETE